MQIVQFKNICLLVNTVFLSLNRLMHLSNTSPGSRSLTKNVNSANSSKMKLNEEKDIFK